MLCTSYLVLFRAQMFLHMRAPAGKINTGETAVETLTSAAMTIVTVTMLCFFPEKKNNQINYSLIKSNRMSFFSFGFP